MIRLLGSVVVVCALVSCSSKESDAPTECVPMTVSSCMCPDGTMSSQTCSMSGSLTPCSCNAAPPTAGAGGGGAGGTPPITTGGTGGTSGAGGTGGVAGAGVGGVGGVGGASGVGGTSGVGGAAGDEDSGVEAPMDAGMDSGTDAGTTPAEGEQNSPCPNGNECNSELGCYVNNHCTKTCMNDTDCDSLPGADYTCYTMSGLCRVICSNDDDCPAGFACQNVAMGGGTTLRCVLP